MSNKSSSSSDSDCSGRLQKLHIIKKKHSHKDHHKVEKKFHSRRVNDSDLERRREMARRYIEIKREDSRERRREMTARHIERNRECSQERRREREHSRERSKKIERECSQERRRERNQECGKEGRRNRECSQEGRREKSSRDSSEERRGPR